MKFLVDAQLPPALCRWLALRDHDAVHVSDVLGGATPDVQVAEFAHNRQRVLITKDDDFAIRHLPKMPQVLWLRIGNATNAALSAWLEPRWAEVITALEEGELLIEVR
jgi:predicted nuclease of predicted toxin-antitoxin system